MTDRLEGLLSALWPTIPDEVRSTADATWPRGRHGHVGWPYSQMMVIPSKRLVYVPIAKNGCSSVKRLMVGLSGLSHPPEMLEHVHACLDFYETGLQLKDWPTSSRQRFLCEPGWFRFAVLRDPCERLVSAYLEKFVYNRHLPGNQIHTDPVVRAVQGTAVADHLRGISFGEFLRSLDQSSGVPPDPHWCDQHDYLPAELTDLRCYALHQLPLVAEDITVFCGHPVHLGHDNAASAPSHIEPLVEVREDLMEALPGEVAGMSLGAITPLMVECCRRHC